MSEPTTQTYRHEAEATFAFDSATGYTYDNAKAQFSGGSITLIDQGGGVYSTSEEVVFPVVTPERVRQWIRIVEISTAPTGTAVAIQFQVSNDNGLNYGISAPDYNDGYYRVYSLAALQAIICYENGVDAIRIKAVLTSDASDTPQLDEVALVYHTYSDLPFEVPYVPLFTSKIYVSRVNRRLTIEQVTDVAMEFGEQWVIDFLEAGHGGTDIIDYEDLITTAVDTSGRWARRLKVAATYAVLCILGQEGVGEGVSGPISSVAADGMSKTYSSVIGIQRGSEDSPLDYCEMASRAMRDFVRIWYATGIGSETEPMMQRWNEMFDPAYDITIGDLRRSNYRDAEP